MELPNLNLIVDTFIRVNDLRLDSYISQLRTELIPEIRRLEAGGEIIWYAFLLHGQQHLNGRVASTDKNAFIHVRLGLPDGSDADQFIDQLPNHFQKPEKVTLSDISGIDVAFLNDEDWAYAWKVHGEASEWVLKLLEAHNQDAIPVSQIIQFMHFITNPLTIGGKCLFLSGGIMQF